MKRFLALILATAVTVTVLTGCGAQGAKAPEGSAVKEINISYVKLPLNVPSIVEKKLELFEKEFEKDGIKVTFPEITEGPKMTEALAAGSLDFCNALGGTSAILAAANGVDLKVIGIYSRAPKAFTLMTQEEGIRSVKDLRGKTVAGPKGTILHQLLLAALKEEGMGVDDVNYVNMSIPQAVAAMNSDSADVAMVAGPAVPQAVEAGGRIIATGEGLLDATIVIAVRGEFLRQHPELVERYMEVHHQSLKYIEEHPDEIIAMAAEETGISKESVVQMLHWYDFNPEITPGDIAELEKTQEFLIQNEMLEKSIDLSGILE